MPHGEFHRRAAASQPLHLDAGTAVCPCCGHRGRLIDLSARTGRPPEFRLFAVETIPAGPERRFTGRGRRIRTASEHDRAIHAAADARLAAELAADPGFLVDGGLPRENRFDNRLLHPCVPPGGREVAVSLGSL
ncbi:putative protein [Methylorubrum extorquens DM4]|uniref:Uncharacterized protein n=1 Tax=Methylorubrum extorquens (strain DSM 6343 / CIP 106787 / DM4) TaxID=661410 RepID=C7CG04_METED|nr:putative protein [Methylorubrum extorquens DM4]